MHVWLRAHVALGAGGRGAGPNLAVPVVAAAQSRPWGSTRLGAAPVVKLSRTNGDVQAGHAEQGSNGPKLASPRMQGPKPRLGGNHSCWIEKSLDQAQETCV